MHGCVAAVLCTAPGCSCSKVHNLTLQLSYVLPLDVLPLYAAVLCTAPVRSCFKVHSLTMQLLVQGGQQPGPSMQRGRPTTKQLLAAVEACSQHKGQMSLVRAMLVSGMVRSGGWDVGA